MSKISLAPNASGTGTLTISAPNTNTDRAIALPDAAGTVFVSGQALSATTGSFSGTISGGSTIGVGGATPSASGAGITFPATQSASSNANTLDDYEEGTWTPTVAFGGASVGLIMSSAVGRYTKVGRVILIQCYLAIQNKGSSTGNMTIGGLPFPSNSYTASYASSPVWGNTLTSISGQLQAYLPVSSQALNIGMSNTGTQSFLTQTNVVTGSDFMLDFSYIVD